MTTYAIDWDSTLVDVHTQEWLPGALERLRQLARTDDVFIHTCRANWPEGHAQVKQSLTAAGLGHLRIEPKPLADVYIDDRAEKPDWAVTTQRARGATSRTLTPRATARFLNGIVVY